MTMSYYQKQKEKKYWTVRKQCRWRCNSSPSCTECWGKGWTLGEIYRVNKPNSRIIYPTVSYDTVAKWESNYQKTLNRKGKQS
jgi:hypothetical protein